MTENVDVYTRDEYIALAEAHAHSYGLRHGLRYTLACHAVIARQDELMAKGDILGALDFRLAYLDVLPPIEQDPALHRAVAKLRRERELTALALRGWDDLAPHERDRSLELLEQRRADLR